MSEPTILVEGLANVNGIDRGSIYELAEPKARKLIKAGFARLHREQPPERQTVEPLVPVVVPANTGAAEIPDEIKQKAKSSAQAKPGATPKKRTVKPKAADEKKAAEKAAAAEAEALKNADNNPTEDKDDDEAST